MAKHGRPLKYTDPAVLQADIDKYFIEKDKPTMSGLAYALGIGRSTLYEYGTKDDFADIVKRAREKVESIYEERIVYGTNPTGTIFALKNMGWKDRQDITSDDEKMEAMVLYKPERVVEK